MRRLLSTTAIAGLAFFVITPAYAACTNNNPVDGETVTCTGTDNIGVSGSNNINLTVNVNAGAVVSTAGTAISIGDGGHVTVAGGGASVFSSGANGIRMKDNTQVDLASGGSITANGGFAILYTGAGSLNTVVNLAGSVDGIAMGDSSATVTLTGSGFATSLDIDAGAAGTDALILNGDGTTNTISSDRLLNFDTSTKSGTGTWNLTGTNAQDWTVSGGTLSTDVVTSVDDVATGASGTFELNTAAGTFAGDVSGTGAFTIIDGSAVTLTGDNSGLTGTLNIDVNSAVTVGSVNALSSAGTININQSTLTFSGGFTAANNFVIGANDATFSAGAGSVILNGNITGATGRFIKAGASNISLNGTNTFGDGLVINAGRITADSVTALGSGAITNGGELVIDLASGSETLTNLMSGAGTFEKRGVGSTLIVNGTQTMTGDVYATEGTLRVNGSFSNANSLTVGNGATLGGSGTVRNVSLSSGAIIAPGNSIGTLNVTGALNFVSGTHYAVEYDNASADKTIASGAITINSGSILDLTGTGVGNDYNVNTVYTILQGASVTGTFGTVNNNLAFLDAVQNNTGTALEITLSRNDINFADVAADDQQAGVGRAITALGDGNQIFDIFTGLTEAQAQDAMDDLSGEHSAGATGTMTQNAGALRNILTAHMSGLNHSSSSDDAAALGMANPDPSVYTAAYIEPAAGAHRVSWDNAQVWLEALGTTGSSDAVGSSPEQDRHSYGMLGGIDMEFEEGGYYGAFAGYEAGNIETDSEGAKSDLDSYHVGLYATKPIGKNYTLGGGVSASYHRIDTDRNVDVGGTIFTPKGDTNGNTLSAFAEISQPVTFNGLALEPYANVSITRSHMDGYTETDGGPANLDVGSSSMTNPATTLGARMGKIMKWDDGKVTLGGSLGWQHTYGDIDSKSTMRFSGGTVSFDSFGPPIARDAAVIGLNINMMVKNSVRAYAAYNGTLAKDAQDHGFTVGINYKF